MLKNILSFIKKVLSDNTSGESYEKPSGGIWKSVNKKEGTSNSGGGIWTKINPKQNTPSQRTIQYTFSDKERMRTVTRQLEQFANGKRPVNWQPSRFLYKVGELRIEEATAYLTTIAQRPQYLRYVRDKNYRYSLIWALGRCGDESVLEKIDKLVLDKEEDFIKRLALDACLTLATPEDKAKIYSELAQNLPSSINDIIARAMPSNEDLIKVFPTDLSLGMPPLYLLYLLGEHQEEYRTFVVSALKSLPMAYPYFQSFRYIFKSAEFRDDFEVLGILSCRFDAKNANFHTRITWKWDKATRTYSQLRIREEKKAFSNRTKAYFQKRITRKLQLLGEQELPAYCHYAKAILERYEEDNAAPTAQRETTYIYENRRYRRVTNHYQTFKQSVLAWITLNTDNEAVSLQKNGNRYRFKQDYYESIKDQRTEPFSQLWDQQAELILDLLLKCRSNYVANFAIKLLDMDKVEMTPEIVLQLVSSHYIEKVNFALEILKKTLSKSSVEDKTWYTLLTAPMAETRAFAMDWAESNFDVFFKSPIFVKWASISTHNDVGKWLRTYEDWIKISAEEKQGIFTKLIQAITQQRSEEKAKVLYKNALGVYASQMHNTALSTATDLLANDLENVQLLGAKILLFQKEKIAQIPEKLIAKMMTGKYLSIRYLGLELFGEMPMELLLQKRDILVSLAISNDPEMREKVKPIIAKSAQGKPEWGVQLCTFFVPLLLQKENYEGLHTDILELLTEYLNDSLTGIPKQQTWELVASNYREANLLGLSLIKDLDFAKEDLRDIIVLANHEMPAIRQQCFDYFNDNVGRVRYESTEALRILDSKWEESRKFAFDFFTKHYKSGDWTPELLVSVCDSTRPDVQEFGKKMMSTFFQAENGADYLLKLSQHPTVSLQLFATNYLEDFATDNLQHFLKLKPYFKTVLCQLCKGGATKKAVFQFLEKEALKDVIVASHVIEILNEVSLTMAIGDKAKCIQVLHRIRKQYPDLESVLEIVEA